MRDTTTWLRRRTLFILTLLITVALAAGSGVTRASASSRADGLSDDVIARGNPPLTRGIIGEVANFFEWLFEKRFSGGQRGELERILVTLWQQQNQNGIATIRQIVELQSKVAALAQEQRGTLRTAMRPEVLRGLRAEPIDDFSRLMISLHDTAGRANVTDSDQASVESKVEAAPSMSGDASALLGAWRDTEISMLQYQNRVTGATTPGNGTSMAYKFYPDGRYDYTGYVQTTMYNCTTTAWNTVTGTYRIEGPRLVLTLKTNDWQMRSLISDRYES